MGHGLYIDDEQLTDALSLDIWVLMDIWGYKCDIILILLDICTKYDMIWVAIRYPRYFCVLVI